MRKKKCYMKCLEMNMEIEEDSIHKQKYMLH